jgi:hypothetical protein
MRIGFVVLCIALAGALMAGCGSEDEKAGYDKASFEKKPVPPGFGPGGGAPATPPASGQ